eukprot:scaffold12169_cov132-Cylindrotheca_fusiformis.AAC.9
MELIGGCVSVACFLRALAPFSASSFALFFSAAQLVGLSNGQQALGNKAHMWIFGSKGVSIFSADGADEVKHLPAEQACHNVTFRGSTGLSCDFQDVVSDGRKYVWAALYSVPKMDVFSIDTGAKVGSFDTCEGATDLDYHSLREEMWIHCATFSDTEESHMDVFSVQSPSSPITSSVTLHDGSLARSYGMFETDATLGDVAYATVYGTPYLNMIDLSSRVVEKKFDLSQNNPEVYGFYDIAYSPKNKHIFARTQVCCTCGFEGAEMAECGHYGTLNIIRE